MQQTRGSGQRSRLAQRRRERGEDAEQTSPVPLCVPLRPLRLCAELPAASPVAQTGTPTAYRPPAQGCAPGATLGRVTQSAPTLNGLCFRRDEPDATLSGLSLFALATQGRRCASTLGWRTERRWRSAAGIPAGFDVNSRGGNPRNRRRAAPALKGLNHWPASPFDPFRVGDCGGEPFSGFHPELLPLRPTD
jgi:hypothetical protein